MRRLTLVFLAAVVACGPSKDRGTDANTGPSDACVGFGCLVVDCAKKGMPSTSISGTVYAPNGTLALYNATVYVPSTDPGPIADDLQCGQCSDYLPGAPVTKTTSDEAGHFTLTNVPAGNDIPLIVQIGKWRRQVLLENVAACTDNPQPAEKTRLPKNHLEGDIPKIAITTGSCDALECLVRRLGVTDGEFTTDSGSGRIHLYNGNGASSVGSGSASMSASTVLWNDVNKLKNYDIVMMSCECGQNPTNKSQAAMNNVKQYADLGGRVFTSHYHNIWIGGEYNTPTHAPAVWKDIATWGDGTVDPGTDTIDQVNNPHGVAFAAWMQNVGGSTSLGQVPIESGTGRQTANTLDSTKAERWVYYDGGSVQYPQNFQFTTPNEAPNDQRCGKVVFSDMHVASDSYSSGMFPSGCSSSALTPQEKALAFMFFDIATCVQVVQ